MIFATQDYRLILQEELKKRIEQNSHYSLRAFARDLQISPARLSEILGHKQGLSRSYAEKIGRRLRMTPAEREYFCDLVESVHGRSQLKRQTAKMRLLKYRDFESRQIQLDTYKVISDWYHFAILELCALKGFQNDPSWIASQLGITTHQVQKAIFRLLRLGLLQKKGGQLSPADNFTATPDGIPSQVIQDSHLQILEKAMSALKNRPVEERNSSAMMMAIDKNRIKEAAEMIKTFRRDFCKDMEKGEEKNAVYCLSIHFFALTQDARPHGKKDHDD